MLRGRVFMESSYIFFIIFAYLLGSIPGGYILAKINKIDLLKQGSGNAGATNVLRTMGKKAAAVTFIFDGAKGFIIVYLAELLEMPSLIVILSGIMVIVGHNWPIFFGFKGGRGIATSLGILFGLSWQVIIVVLIVGLTIIAVTRYVSLGSIIGAVVLPPVMILFDLPLFYIIFGVIMSLLSIIRHIPNIKRLISGNELKIGEKKG